MFVFISTEAFFFFFFKKLSAKIKYFSLHEENNLGVSILYPSFPNCCFYNLLLIIRKKSRVQSTRSLPPTYRVCCVFFHKQLLFVKEVIGNDTQQGINIINDYS